MLLATSQNDRLSLISLTTFASTLIANWWSNKGKGCCLVRSVYRKSEVRINSNCIPYFGIDSVVSIGVTAGIVLSLSLVFALHLVFLLLLDFGSGSYLHNCQTQQSVSHRNTQTHLKSQFHTDKYSTPQSQSTSCPKRNQHTRENMTRSLVLPHPHPHRKRTN